jgi:dolichol-phosphate mannosyltransferase
MKNYAGRLPLATKVLTRLNCPLVFAVNSTLQSALRVNETLIIVPTYNERENLPRMAQKLLSLPAAVDVLVVDDSSPDGTGKIAYELASRHPQIHVLHRAGKEGLGRAYIAGFKWALENKYEFIFEMDCDFSHNPDDIPAFLEAAKDADLVLGSRYVGGIRVINWPLGRLMLSRFAGKYVALVTGMPFSDPTGGYKCFRRRALQALNLEKIQCYGYGFQIELTNKLWRQGFKIVEVPIIFTERTQGQSKMAGGIVNEAFWLVWRLWLQNGLRRSPRVKNRPI